MLNGRCHTLEGITACTSAKLLWDSAPDHGKPCALQARPSSHAKPTYFGTFSRRLQQLPTPESFEPAVPEETQAFAAQAPTSAPGALNKTAICPSVPILSVVGAPMMSP